MGKPRDSAQAISPANRNEIERVYREHNENLIRFLRARLPNDSDAREAAQEAYVRLLGLDDPEQPSFLRAYLFRVAANVATDVLRRRAVALRNVGGLAGDGVEAATQERSLAARQDLVRVQRAVAELPPRCREAFTMSRFEGRTTNEIAGRLGVSERMVRLYLMRALEHLQHAVEGRGRGDGA